MGSASGRETADTFSDALYIRLCQRCLPKGDASVIFDEREGVIER